MKSSLVSSTAMLSSARVSLVCVEWSSHPKKKIRPLVFCFLSLQIEQWSNRYATMSFFLWQQIVDKTEEMIGSYAAQVAPIEKKASWEIVLCKHTPDKESSFGKTGQVDLWSNNDLFLFLSFIPYFSLPLRRHQVVCSLVDTMRPNPSLLMMMVPSTRPGTG